MNKTRLNKILNDLIDNKISVDTASDLIIKLSAVKKVADRVYTKADIDEIYKAYPTRCVVNGSPNGKTLKDKDRIKSRLSDISKEKLIATIKRYVSDCKTHKVFMKNFSTFLNNIPEYDTEEAPKPKVVFNGGHRNFREINSPQ